MGPEEGGRGHPAGLPGGECHRALHPGRERDELGHGFREEDGNDVCPGQVLVTSGTDNQEGINTAGSTIISEVEQESVEEIRDLETRLAILRDRCGLPPGGMES